jgi:hypothetical protein
MTNSMWQQTEEMAKKHDQGGSLWLKLAGDGDKAVVVFLGEPHPREVAFVDGKYVEVDEKMKAAGTKASLRVALNVALYDSKEVKVLEQGVMFFKDLVRVREKYGLEKWAFEIQRHGAAKDPKTTYSILPEHQLSVEQQKAFQALPQHDLAKLYSGEADGRREGWPVARQLRQEERREGRRHRGPQRRAGARHRAQGAAARGDGQVPREVRRPAHQGPADVAGGEGARVRRAAPDGERRARRRRDRGRSLRLSEPRGATDE